MTNSLSRKPLRECHTVGEALQSSEFLERVAESVPKHVNGERIFRVFSAAVGRQPLLAQADMRTFVGACLSFGQLGLEPNSPLGQAYLIPFKRKIWNPETRKRDKEIVEIQPLTGYQGMLDLAYRSPLVTSVQAHVVLEGDTFEYDYGTEAFLRHKPYLGKNAGERETVCAYMVARLQDGFAFEIVPWGEVEKIRNKSQAYMRALDAKDEAAQQGRSPPKTYTEAPWVAHPIAMARKTAVRAGIRYVPRSVEMANAIALEDAGEAGRHMQFQAWERAITYVDKADGKVRHDYVSAVIDETEIADQEDDPRDERVHERRGQATRTQVQVQQPDTKSADKQADKQADKSAEKPAARQPAEKPPANEPPVDRWGDPEPPAKQPPAANAPAGGGNPPAAPANAPAATTKAAATRAKAGAKVNAPTFSQTMLNEFGELEPLNGSTDEYSDPVIWAGVFVRMLESVPEDLRAALIEYNTEGEAAARAASPQAREILEAALAKVDTGPKEFQVMDVPPGREGPDWDAYANIVEGISDLNQDDVLPWAAAQRGTWERAPMLVRMRLIRWLMAVKPKDAEMPAWAPALMDKEAKEGRVEDERQPDLVPGGPPAAEPPATTPPAQASASAPADDRWGDPPDRFSGTDEQKADQILAELAQCKDPAAVMALSSDTDIRLLMVGSSTAPGWKKTNPELFDRVRGAFAARVPT